MTGAGERCGRVVDNDDSIGGEGEIKCGAPMLVKGGAAVCAEDHRWIACDCGGPTCTGWKVARWNKEANTWA